MRYDQMLGDPACPFKFSLDVKKGMIFPGKPPYPELVVLSAETEHVREIRWQQFVVRARLPETGKTDNVRIMRLVAVLEGGQEMELSRMALPVDVETEVPSDPTTCAGCGKKIPHGAGIKAEGKHWHNGMCWVE